MANFQQGYYDIEIDDESQYNFQDLPLVTYDSQTGNICEGCAVDIESYEIQGGQQAGYVCRSTRLNSVTWQGPARKNAGNCILCGRWPFVGQKP